MSEPSEQPEQRKCRACQRANARPGRDFCSQCIGRFGSADARATWDTVMAAKREIAKMGGAWKMWLQG